MLKEKIKNNADFTEEERNKLLQFLNKEELSTFDGFPENYKIDIGYEEGYEDAIHLIKPNPGNIKGFEDSKYILIMIKGNENILVDGSDIPNAFKVDNIDEMKHYMSLEEE